MTPFETWIVDRFEGDLVVVERGDAFLSLPRALVPLTAKEGDALAVLVEGDQAERRCVLRIDAAAKVARAKSIGEIAKRLHDGDGGGDLVL